jgi:hypothetical protein
MKPTFEPLTFLAEDSGVVPQEGRQPGCGSPLGPDVEPEEGSSSPRGPFASECFDGG